MSLLLRRIHLYLALFLGPWILMYTASTFVINHRSWFRGPEPVPPPPFVKESEFTYSGELPSGATPQQTALQILAAAGLDGAHGVGRPAPDGTLIINRQDAVAPRRISYTPSTRRVLIEKMEYNTPAFLERMHRRRGFQHPYLLDDIWAVLVDCVILAILFWSCSGLWMWWELKVTRPWGAAALAGGVLLFGILVAVL
jgi:hypothetical protein